MTVIHYKDVTSLEDITCAECLKRVGMILLDRGTTNCAYCSGLGTLDFHSCPFAKEIHGNYTEDCNCCDECTSNCALEI